MALVLNIGDRERLVVEARTASDLPARLPAPPTWAVDLPILTLNPSADGHACNIRADSAGDCTVTVTSGPLSLGYAVSVLSAVPTHLTIKAEVITT